MPKRQTILYTSNDAPRSEGAQLFVYYCKYSGKHAFTTGERVCTDVQLHWLGDRDAEHAMHALQPMLTCIVAVALPHGSVGSPASSRTAQSCQQSMGQSRLALLHPHAANSTHPDAVHEHEEIAADCHLHRDREILWAVAHA